MSANRVFTPPAAPRARLERRSELEALPVRLVRGTIGGLLSGAVFLGITMWWTAAQGGSSDMPILMMSTILLGDGALADGTTNLGAGLGVHVVLSAVYGMLFALVMPWLRNRLAVVAAGAAYGLALYVINFQILSPWLFETFQGADQGFEVVAHLQYGLMVGLSFLGARSMVIRRVSDPAPAAA